VNERLRPIGPLSALSDDDLLQRVGEMAYAQQMSALEGLTLDDQTLAEARALEEEIQRRGLQRQ
jgi:hypothetical protein